MGDDYPCSFPTCVLAKETGHGKSIPGRTRGVKKKRDQLGIFHTMQVSIEKT